MRTEYLKLGINNILLFLIYGKLFSLLYDWNLWTFLYNGITDEALLITCELIISSITLIGFVMFFKRLNSRKYSINVTYGGVGIIILIMALQQLTNVNFGNSLFELKSPYNGILRTYDLHYMYRYNYELGLTVIGLIYILSYIKKHNVANNGS